MIHYLGWGMNNQIIKPNPDYLGFSGDESSPSTMLKRHLCRIISCCLNSCSLILSGFSPPTFLVQILNIHRTYLKFLEIYLILVYVELTLALTCYLPGSSTKISWIWDHHTRRVLLFGNAQYKTLHNHLFNSLISLKLCR